LLAVCNLFVLLICTGTQESHSLRGHTKLTTTQIYVHVLNKKISEDMNALKQKFETISSQKSNEMRNIAG